MKWVKERSEKRMEARIKHKGIRNNNSMNRGVTWETSDEGRVNVMKDEWRVRAERSEVKRKHALLSFSSFIRSVCLSFHFFSMERNGRETRKERMNGREGKWEVKREKRAFVSLHLPFPFHSHFLLYLPFVRLPFVPLTYHYTTDLGYFLSSLASVGRDSIRAFFIPFRHSFHSSAVKGKVKVNRSLSFIPHFVRPSLHPPHNPGHHWLGALVRPLSRLSGVRIGELLSEGRTKWAKIKVKLNKACVSLTFVHFSLIWVLFTLISKSMNHQLWCLFLVSDAVSCVSSFCFSFFFVHLQWNRMEAWSEQRERRNESETEPDTNHQSQAVLFSFSFALFGSRTSFVTERNKRKEKEHRQEPNSPGNHTAAVRLGKVLR